MKLIYLDYNCFQRGFDDSSQTRIQMEALACQEIFVRAEAGKCRLIWSFIHQDESLLCPFPERQIEVLRLSALCQIRIGPEEEIRDLAKSFQHKASLSAKDALHLAVAVYAQADAFLTCDEALLKRAKRLGLELMIANPIDYLRKEAANGES